jgi:hypothetical protein
MAAQSSLVLETAVLSRLLLPQTFFSVREKGNDPSLTWGNGNRRQQCMVLRTSVSFLPPEKKMSFKCSCYIPSQYLEDTFFRRFFQNPTFCGLQKVLPNLSFMLKSNKKSEEENTTANTMRVMKEKCLQYF